MENKFSFKWIALLASAAGTPWMVNQATQGRNQTDITAVAEDNANALWNSAKGSFAQFDSFLHPGQTSSSKQANTVPGGWSFPSDPKSLNQAGASGGAMPQISPSAFGTGSLGMGATAQTAISDSAGGSPAIQVQRGWFQMLTPDRWSISESFFDLTRHQIGSCNVILGSPRFRVLESWMGIELPWSRERASKI